MHFISGSNDRTLAGPVALAYTFGLRHALDADHIAAIDNVRPTGCGLIGGMQEASCIRSNSWDCWDILQVSHFEEFS